MLPNQVSNAMGKSPGLAATGAGNHQQRTLVVRFVSFASHGVYLAVVFAEEVVVAFGSSGGAQHSVRLKAPNAF